ncbi:MAG: thioredoxin-disulfide reductase [Clostridia bacterium]|nr:thioredoxin-disulfide reductase [Clostridia bacterium]MBQ5833637.1 thioredoxin-disulfide reductase [Clostridia bacterium]
MIYDIIIIGAGPAGMTAALYALRAEKSVLILDGNGYGGQIAQSQGVENYPGIPSVNGMDFADALMGQIQALGVEMEFALATAIRKEGDLFTVESDGGTYEGRSVILATGLKHRKLGVEGEESFLGRGVSFCAVCDGAFFRRMDVAVVGGGNTAVQDALYLAEICSRVYLVHRRDQFRAEEAVVTRLKEHPNITCVLDSTVASINGDTALRSLTVENRKTGERSTIEVAAVFEAVGMETQNGAFAELVALDEDGYLLAGEDCKTSVKGLFAAGDCRRKSIRQLTTAVCDGTVAALAAMDYLKEQI